MPSDDPAAHNINDNPATHDVNDDPIARAGFVSNDRDAGTAAPGLPTPAAATMQSRCTAELMCWMAAPDRTS
jgi:hypothetical protein